MPSIPSSSRTWPGARRRKRRAAPTRGSIRTRGRSVTSSAAASSRRRPRSGSPRPIRPPATALAQIAQGSAADVDAAVRAARAAQPGWCALGGHARARHLYAIARHIQKQSRLFAVLESLDNGKPIRESRDIDIPLVARHFYHHAGLGPAHGARVPRRGAGGCRGADHSLEFPAAHAGLENRARARDGKHGRAQARRVHVAHRASVRGDLPRGRPAPRVS